MLRQRTTPICLVLPLVDLFRAHNKAVDEGHAIDFAAAFIQKCNASAHAFTINLPKLLEFNLQPILDHVKE